MDEGYVFKTNHHKLDNCTHWYKARVKEKSIWSKKGREIAPSWMHFKSVHARKPTPRAETCFQSCGKHVGHASRGIVK